MARSDPQLNFRIPAALKENLEEAARDSGRSLTAELIERLEQSFADQFSAATLRDWMEQDRLVNTMLIATLVARVPEAQETWSNLHTGSFLERLLKTKSGEEGIRRLINELSGDYTDAVVPLSQTIERNAGPPSETKPSKPRRNVRSAD